jgi:hypothetical protein
MNNIIEQKEVAPTFNSTTKSFSLEPTNFVEAKEFAELISKTDMVPKQYKNKPADILVAMMLGTQVGLPGLVALQHIAVINGRPSLWGDSMLALVKSHPECEYIHETFNDETMTATCIAKRKNNPECKRSFSLDDAKKAGLMSKQGPWQTYTKRMLQMRARGFALRDSFPDALNGLITVEEARDYPDEKKEYKNITPKNVTTEEELTALVDKRDYEKISPEQIVILMQEIEDRNVNIEAFYEFCCITKLEDIACKDYEKVLEQVKRKPRKPEAEVDKLKEAFDAVEA